MRELDAVSRRKRRGRRKGLVALTVVLAVFIILTLLLTALYHSSPFHRAEQMGGSNTQMTESYKTPEKVKDKMMNILLCGVDYDSEAKGRSNRLSDVMMLCSYDIAHQKLNILQFPRDTYVDDKYHTGGLNKMNGIYNQKDGGINGLIAAINGNFALTVDHYVTVGMDDVRTIVDQLGGVEINLDKGFTTTKKTSGKTFVFKEGKQTLNGEQAQAFVRERGAFANADITRQKNQKIFIAGLVDRLLASGLWDVLNLLPTLAKNVSTDFTIGEMLSLATTAKDLKKENIVFHSPPGHYLRARTESGARQDVFGMNKQATADMLNEYFRPYSGAVPAEKLGIIQITDKITIEDPNKPLAGLSGEQTAGS